MKLLVLDFIEKFKFIHAKELEESFSCGNCYYFAVILKERFGGEICYIPVNNHFVCQIEHNYYDIKGKVTTKEKVYTWDKYKIYEPLDSHHVIRDCLNFHSR